MFIGEKLHTSGRWDHIPALHAERDPNLCRNCRHQQNDACYQNPCNVNSSHCQKEKQNCQKKSQTIKDNRITINDILRTKLYNNFQKDATERRKSIPLNKITENSTLNPLEVQDTSNRRLCSLIFPTYIAGPHLKKSRKRKFCDLNMTPG